MEIKAPRLDKQRAVFMLKRNLMIILIPPFAGFPLLFPLFAMQLPPGLALGPGVCGF
jgi:hypothetical protein